MSNNDTTSRLQATLAGIRQHWYALFSGTAVTVGLLLIGLLTRNRVQPMPVQPTGTQWITVPLITFLHSGGLAYLISVSLSVGLLIASTVALMINAIRVRHINR